MPPASGGSSPRSCFVSIRPRQPRTTTGCRPTMRRVCGGRTSCCGRWSPTCARTATAGASRRRGCCRHHNRPPGAAGGDGCAASKGGAAPLGDRSFGMTLANATVPLTARAGLVAMHRDVANQIRGALKTFGLVLGKVAAGAFEARVRQLIAGNPFLIEVIEALLKVWRTTGEQLVTLHRRVLRLTQTDETCRRLMTCRGLAR